MDAPFYLAVGSCVLEPGDGSADYHVTSMSFPEPDPDGFGGHNPATRTITLRVDGSSVADISANIAALRREAVRDERLYFRPALTGDVVECKIREARVVEDSYNPLRRSVSNPSTTLTLTIETEPYWLGPWTDERVVLHATIPSDFIITDVPGEVDALLRARSVPTRDGTAQIIGIRPTDDADFLAPYPLGVDSNANGLSDSWSVSGTPTVYTPPGMTDKWQRMERTWSSGTEYMQVGSPSMTAAEGDIVIGQMSVFGTNSGQSALQLVPYNAGGTAITYPARVFTISATPQTITYKAVMPADTVRVRMFFQAALTSGACDVSCREASLVTTKYAPLDDYGTASDTSDANALGGYKLGETVDASLAGNEIGTAPNIEISANRGRHLVVARFDHNATTSTNVSARVSTTTTGNLISSSAVVDEAAITASSANLIGYEMGSVMVPSGQVPGITTGAGWSPEAVKAQQATDDGTRSLTGSGGNLVIEQTFAGFAGLVTAVEYTVDTAPSVAPYSAQLYVLIDGSGYAPALNIPTSVGTHKVVLPSPVEVPSGSTLGFQIWLSASSTFTVAFAVGSNRYSSGSLSALMGTGVQANDDLVFKVYGQEKRGFPSTMAIQAACSESSKTIYLDYVQRIPVNYAALVYRRASGSLAMFYDGDTDTPYIADADGIGPAIYDKCEIRKPLRVRPGVVNRVVQGILQGDETVLGGTFTYSVRPRYLTATG